MHMWMEYISSRHVCHLNKCRNKKTYDNMIFIIAFINGKRLVAKSMETTPSPQRANIPLL